MKRITTILSLLMLVCMGAGATTYYYTVSNPTIISSLSSLSDDDYYILKNCGSGRYNYYNKSTGLMDAIDTYDGTSLVKLLYNESTGVVHIKQVCTDKYYQALGNGTRVSLGTTPVDFTFNTSGVDDNQFRFANGDYYMNRNSGSTEYPTGAATSFTGNYSRWNIYKVDVVIDDKITVNVVDGTNNPIGTLNTKNPSTRLTSQAAAGFEGVTVDGNAFDQASWLNSRCLSVKPGAAKSAEKIQITAPAGYVISGYSIECFSVSPSNPYLIDTNSDGDFAYSGTSVPTSKTTYEVTDINMKSTYFWIYCNAATVENWLGVSSFKVYLKDAESLTSLSGINTSRCYNIENVRGWWAVADDGTDVNSTQELSLATSNPSNTKLQFAFIPYNEKYYLYSVNTGKFAYATGSSTGAKLALTNAFTDDVEASNVTFVASTHAIAARYPTVIAIKGHHYGVSPANYSPDVIFYDDAGDEGNAAAIVPAGSFDNATALGQIASTVNVTYKVMLDGSQKATATAKALEGDDLDLPSSLVRAYCTYKYYSNAACTSEITTVPAGGGDVYVAIDEWSGPVEYTANTSSPIYYNMSIRSKYMVYDDNATGDVTLKDSSEPFSNDASWAFIGNPYDGFNIINKTKGTGYYLTYTSIVTGGNGGVNNVQFVEKATAEADNDGRGRTWLIDQSNSNFVLRMKENNNIYFHHDNTHNLLRTCSKAEWGAVHTDAGSTIVTLSDEATLYSLYDLLKDVPYGTGVGQYRSTDEENMPTNAIVTNLNGVKYVIDNNMMAAYPDAYSALEGIRDGIALCLPSAGYYRLKGLTSGKYLAAGFASNGKFAMTDATDATTIFYFADSKLRNVSSGKYNATTSSDWSWVDAAGSAATVEFVDGLTYLGTYGIKTSNACFYDNGDNTSSADRGGITTITTSDDARYRKWQLEPVSSYDLALNSVGDGNYYATLCLPFDVTISGADAYTLDQSGKWLVPTQLDGNEVPAGTPVLLKGTEETANVAINTGDAFSSTSNVNDLLGVYVPTDFALDETATGEESSEVDCTSEYFLGVFNNEVGFYHSGVVSKTGYYTLGANKAYLPASQVAASRGFAIKWNDDEVTGIRAINNGKQSVKNGAFYDLSGRRVENPQHGLYIVNGRVVVIK